MAENTPVTGLECAISCGRAASSPFVRQKLGFFIAKQRSQDLEELRKLLDSGEITPVVDRTFPLDEVPDAIRYLRDGRARGKIVVTT